jgi:murein L,D-transpeptidase YcbB/YkuD
MRGLSIFRLNRAALAHGRMIGVSLAALWLGLLAGQAPANAQDPIAQILQQKGTDEWSDGFDSGARGAADVRTSTPILSPEILDATGRAIAQYSDIVARGGWPSVPADRKLHIGMRGPAIAALRERLIIGGDLDASTGASEVFDSYVEAAVRRFQARHGLPVDGVVSDSTFAAMNIPAAVRLNQLSTNLTRLKGLMAKIAPRFIMVNIPAAQVEAVEQGQVVSRHTAIVGKVDRPSPMVNSKIYEINFNPYWTVPASIIKKDLIPKMQADPNYTTKFHIRIYNQQGQELQPEQINWNSDEATKYLFREDPGDTNSLGLVKINFYSKDGVYMHDTPQKGLFNDEYRFDSSGCVRIQNIRELITWLLRDTPGWNRDMIDEMFKNGQRLDVKLAQQVPVYWVYVTAWAVSDGVVNFRNDIYGLDGLEQFATATAEGGPGQQPPGQPTLTPPAPVGVVQPVKSN